MWGWDSQTEARVWRVIALTLACAVFWQLGALRRPDPVPAEVLEAASDMALAQRGTRATMTAEFQLLHDRVAALERQIADQGEAAALGNRPTPLPDGASPRGAIQAPAPPPSSPPTLAPTMPPPPTSPPTLTPVPTMPAPTSPPEPTPAPPPARTLYVTNTGGQGAYLRATPRLDDRLRPWVEGTPMRATGAETEIAGFRWLQVVDPLGNIGWMPAIYLRE